MSNQYAPKTFLRQVRGALVNRCLRRHGIDLDLNREIIKPAVVDELFEQLTSLPPEKLRRVEGDFTAIAELASAKGTEAILREAKRHGVDLADIFMQARNGYERACWTFVEHPALFEVAAYFYEMDRFGDGRWNRRSVAKGLTPVVTRESLDHLTAFLQHSFAKEGRGRYCHIDYYTRQEPLRHCFFAFPEDHASTDLGYTEAGELRRHTRKAAFEVIFVYRPEDGMLEVLAPGGGEQIDDLAACFCTAILNLPALPPKIAPKLFDLSPLKSPDLQFPTDPYDRIERVELREVCLSLGRSRGWKRRVIFQADDKASWRDSIHQMILHTVQADGIRLTDVMVTAARFRFIFAAVDNQRPKHLTFTVTSSDHCTLRDNYHDQIARKYLHRWGLTLDGSVAQDSWQH